MQSFFDTKELKEEKKKLEIVTKKIEEQTYRNKISTWEDLKAQNMDRLDPRRQHADVWKWKLYLQNGIFEALMLWIQPLHDESERRTRTLSVLLDEFLIYFEGLVKMGTGCEEGSAEDEALRKTSGIEKFIETVKEISQYKNPSKSITNWDKIRRIATSIIQYQKDRCERIKTRVGAVRKSRGLSGAGRGAGGSAERGGNPVLESNGGDQGSGAGNVEEPRNQGKRHGGGGVAPSAIKHARQNEAGSRRNRDGVAVSQSQEIKVGDRVIKIKGNGTEDLGKVVLKHEDGKITVTSDNSASTWKKQSQKNFQKV